MDADCAIGVGNSIKIARRLSASAVADVHSQYTMSGSSITYRRDIDGLRAVAILPVLLFHARIPGFTGGYVGVDVFFVISGFLITSTICEEIKKGRFSTLSFYERRIRRIFPALFFMLAVSTVLAALILYPEEYRRFTRSLIAAALFFSTFLFYGESGYFDGAAEEKPLLHTWSLSVEEIFYVAFPLALLLAWRRFGDRWFWAIAITGLLSLAASGLVLLREPGSAAAFYLPHYRAWELLLGALLALRSPSRMIYAKFGNLLTALGLLMIAAAVFIYTEETTFPGFAALLPCVGAALVIAFGQHATSSVHALLTNRLVVSTGLISYSLYLWHWPVLVFHYDWAGRRPSEPETAVLIGLSFILAIVSWRFVERPFRGSGALFSRRTLYAASAGVVAVMIAVGIHGELSEGWIGRYGEAVSASLAAANNRDPRQAQCLSPKPDAAGCLYGAAGAAPSMVLWGDSHAAVFADMLGRVAAQHGEAVKVFTMWSCPPTIGWQIEKQAWRADCARLQDLAMDTILRSPEIHSVVLVSRFRHISTIPDREGATAAFYATVDRLLNAGKKVVIVYPVPEGRARLSQGPDNISEGEQARSLITQRTEDYLNETRDAFEWLDNLGNREHLIRVYPHRLLCDALRCYAYRENKAYYWDRHHLSLAGAALFAPLFDSILFGKNHPPSE